MLLKILSLSLLLVSCAHTPKPEKRDPRSVAEEDHKRQLMVGKWHGTNLSPDGEPMEALVNRKLTGEYEVIYLFGTETPKTCLQVKGVWGVSSNIYFTITKELNEDGKKLKLKPQDSGGYLAYEIIFLDEKEFRFKDLEFNNLLLYKKVADDFALKEKNLTCLSK